MMAKQKSLEVHDSGSMIPGGVAGSSAGGGGGGGGGSVGGGVTAARKVLKKQASLPTEIERSYNPNW